MSKMLNGTTSERHVHVDATPAEVYGLVSDVTRMGEWSPETTKCVWMKGPTGPAVGALFKGTNKHGLMTWSTKPTVIVADPGREFAFEIEGVIKWTYQFDADGTGTKLSESFELLRDLPWYYAVAQRWGMGVKDRRADLEHGIEVTLDRIKKVLETHASDRN